MATCPSGQYHAKVRTRSGYVPGHAYNLAPSEHAYGEWYELELALLFDGHASLRQLSSVKTITAWTQPETLAWHELDGKLAQLDARYAALPDARAIFQEGAQLAAALGAIEQLAIDTACVQQQIDDQIKVMGGKPIDRSDGSPKSMSVLGHVLVVAGVVAAGTAAVYSAKALSNRIYGSEGGE